MEKIECSNNWGGGLKMEKSEENMSCKMKKNFVNWS